MSKCHQSTSARLVVQDVEKTKHNVSIFISMITKIVQYYNELNAVDIVNDSVDTEEKLLCSGMQINSGNVVANVDKLPAV